MIPPALQDEIEKSLAGKFNFQYSILNSQPVGGGCINNTHKLETNRGNFFLKWNDKKRFPKMFVAEAKGLSLLRSTNTLYISEVILEGEAYEQSFLILEWLDPRKRQPGFWKNFGVQLATLHQHTEKDFGHDHDNYIGSLPQCNNQHVLWTEFFIRQRLEPQLKLAIDSGKLPLQVIDKSSSLFRKLAELVPDEKPSLLHGDLWNGNYMIAPDGFACLIDPAVYYGHREMDLSMTKLFGGFDADFYTSYHDQFPLKKNFESRVDVHNLYPLLVHVNLFGGGYIQQVKSILSRF